MSSPIIIEARINADFTVFNEQEHDLTDTVAWVFENIDPEVLDM